MKALLSSLVGVTFVAALLYAPPTWAESSEQYVQTMTCNPTGLNRCKSGEDPRPVRWYQSEVDYHVNEIGSPNLQSGQEQVTDDILESVWASFDAWNDVECSDFQMTYAGTTSHDETGYDPALSDGDDIHLVVWRDDYWPNAGYNAVALTTVTFRSSTGQILSADIEFNSAEYTFTNTEGQDGAVIDLQNTLTHEAGHFLGLDHSPIPEATMYATAPPAEIAKRELHQVDIDGICSIYPVGGSYQLEQREENRTSTNRICGTIDSPSNAPSLAIILIGLLIFRRRMK